MDDNRLRFGVGVLVIAAIGIGVILTFLFGAVPRVFTSEFRLLVRFEDAEGISADTPVLLRGVEIGRVISKKLEPDHVLVEVGIQSQYQQALTHQYVPQIGTANFVTRDSKLEFVRATDADLANIAENLRQQPYTNDELFSGKKSSDPFSVLFNLEDDLKQTLQSVRGASDSLRDVGEGINTLVSDAQGVVGKADDRLSDVSGEARQALIEFQGAMREIRELVGDPELKTSLTKSLEQLPNTLSEAQTTLQSTRETFESFEKVGQQFERVGVAAEKTVNNVDQTVDAVRDTIQSAQRSFQSAEKAIQNIETITEPIAENSDQIVSQTLHSLRQLDQTLQQVETFGAALNNSDGTLRKILEDDDIYWQIRRTIENVEMASAKLRPILDDVRIFSDKIARDPRELGVRGALSKRGSGLGLK